MIAAEERRGDPPSSWIALVLLVLFIVLPLCVIIIQSFTSDSFLQFPPSHFGTRWYAYVFQSNLWRDATGRSFLIAALVVPSAIIIGAAAALALDRGPTGAAAVMQGFLISPMVLPQVVLGLGILRLALFASLNDTIFGFYLAHLIVCVPFVIVTVGASLKNVDKAQEEAALSLGAGEWNVIRHVTLPAIWPGIIGGAIFAFIASFDEFILSYYLATFKVTLPIQIFSSLSYQLEPSVAVISTLVLVLTSLLTALVLARGQVIAAGRIVK